jgi:hypothetical protein
MLAGGPTTTTTDSRVVVVVAVLLEEPQIQTVGVVRRKLATVEAE